MWECKQVVTCIVIASLSLTWACSGPEKEIEEGLSTQVLFFSNFEKGVDAFTATGSGTRRTGRGIHTLPEHRRKGGWPPGFSE